MTQDEIIEITKQAGGFSPTPEFLEAFAKLVEARTAAKEREACARLSTEAMGGPHLFGTHQEWLMHKHGVVAYHNLIRARGEA